MQPRVTNSDYSSPKMLNKAIIKYHNEIWIEEGCPLFVTKVYNNSGMKSWTSLILIEDNFYIILINKKKWQNMKKKKFQH